MIQEASDIQSSSNSSSLNGSASLSSTSETAPLEVTQAPPTSSPASHSAIKQRKTGAMMMHHEASQSPSKDRPPTPPKQYMSPRPTVRKAGPTPLSRKRSTNRQSPPPSSTESDDENSNIVPRAASAAAPSSTSSAQQHLHKKAKVPLINAVKMVRFHSRVRVRRVPTLSETPESVLKDVYYSPDELSLMREELRQKLKRHIASQLPPETEEEDGMVDKECADKEEDNTSVPIIIPTNVDHDLDYDETGLFYVRGLEIELPRSRNHRKLWKLVARKHVMKAQYVQHVQHGCILYPEVMAQTYRRLSKRSVDWSLVAGVQDEAIAKQIYAETDDAIDENKVGDWYG